MLFWNIETTDLLSVMLNTFCILYDILFNVDGYDSRREENEKWEGKAGHHTNEDIVTFKKHWR